MQAIILAAGASSRFWPLGEGKHKSLISVLGKSLLLRTIESIASAGVKDIVIVQNLSARLEKSVAAPKDVSLKFVSQPEARGMGDAILQAKSHITGSFFVVSPYHINAGDIIKKILEIREKSDVHKKPKTERVPAEKVPEIILVGKKTDTPEIYGIFKIAGGKAAGIVEKPKRKDAPSDIRAVGVYFLPKRFIVRLESELPLAADLALPAKQIKGAQDAHYSFESALEKELNSAPAELIITEDFQPTLKYPWDVFAIEKYVLDDFFKDRKQMISKEAHIDKTAKIDGNVFIGQGTTVMENAVIKGPCFIGENCAIGNNALLRSYVDVANDAKIGANTEIARSIIGAGTHIHSGFIGDSIITEDCRIGAGFITANTRIDRAEISAIVKGEKTPTCLKSFGAIIGRDTKIGVGVKTMPGILIGANCKIGPGTVVNENVESDTTYFSEFKGVVKKEKKPKILS